MSKKTSFLLLFLLISIFIFIFVTLSNRQVSETAIITEETDPQLDEDVKSQGDLDKFFQFDSSASFDSDTDDINLPEVSITKDQECILNDQKVKAGTVASNTTCVGE